MMLTTISHRGSIPAKLMVAGLAGLAFLLQPCYLWAHQPRLVLGTQTIVTVPEVSKAYYGELSGTAHVYKIQATQPFALYVNILVPDIPDQKRDLSATIVRLGNQPQILATLQADSIAWRRYWEEFGRDWYWMGPEYRNRAEAAEYEIRVTSPDNQSKYTLAIGETEAFDFKEGMNALRMIPVLKRDFFGVSPIGFILSPFGYGYVLISFGLAIVAGLLFRSLHRIFTRPAARGPNISSGERLLRVAIAAGILLWAITTSWNPLLLFLSGLTLFTATFGWCGISALLGRNSCASQSGLKE